MSARKKQPKKRTKATGKRVKSKPASGRKKPARTGASASRPKGGAKSKAASAAAKKAAAKQALKAKQDALKAKQAREREKAQALKEREREKAQAAREKAQALKEREREKAEQLKQKAREQKEREKQKAEREKQKAREQKEREKQKALAERDKAREKAEREADKARKKKEAEAQKAREKAEREAEKRRLAAEREAEKEALRKAKEEERARREAEREAYRKAKEAERERLRAEREAARRIRESKVARATRAAQRVDGLRMGSSRVYDPSAIPNQSGTTRHTGASQPIVHRLVGVRHADSSPRNPLPAEAQPHPQSLPQPLPPIPEHRPTPPPSAPLPPVAEGIEERYRRILERLATGPEALKKEYEETLEMSWIHHDSALEGVVYTFQELRAAMDPSASSTPDSSMQPVCEEIRRHRQAIAYVRDLGERKRVPLNVDVVKRLFVMLHPEEGDVKTVKYRKDIPQHRLYFHEYAAPDKIAYRVRQIMDWLNGPEAKKMKNPLRVGARVHYDLLRVFPFAQDSGKVARLLMNIVLLRGGYPPAIVHSTERQRYYEALKGQLPVIIQLVNESIMNALGSIEKRLDDEARAAS
jgi:Fic/DOC family protein